MQGRVTNHAGSMINEDHLKKILGKTGSNPWKASNNKLLPRSQHSPFGDFPATHMPKKEAKVDALANTAACETSAARKFLKRIHSSFKLNSATVVQVLHSRKERDSVESPLPSRSQRKEQQPPSPEQEPATDAPFPLRSSAASTTGEISPSPSTTAPRTSFSGKLTSCLLTTITTSPSSSRASVRSKILTVFSLCREPSTCSKRVVPRFYQLSHNSSSLSRVSNSKSF